MGDNGSNNGSHTNILDRSGKGSVGDKEGDREEAYIQAGSRSQHRILSGAFYTFVAAALVYWG